MTARSPTSFGEDGCWPAALKRSVSADRLTLVWRPAIASSAPRLLRAEARPDAMELLFSSSGRLSRTPFLAGMACVLGALWLYDRWIGGVLRLLTGWAVLAVLLFSGCCLVSRRLHDLGRAGWWTACGLGLFLVAYPGARGEAGSVSAALLAVFALALCLTPGQASPNRFGPPL